MKIMNVRTAIASLRRLDNLWCVLKKQEYFWPQIPRPSLVCLQWQYISHKPVVWCFCETPLYAIPSVVVYPRTALPISFILYFDISVRDYDLRLRIQSFTNEFVYALWILYLLENLDKFVDDVYVWVAINIYFKPKVFRGSLGLLFTYKIIYYLSHTTIMIARWKYEIISIFCNGTLNYIK